MNTQTKPVKQALLSPREELARYEQASQSFWEQAAHEPRLVSWLLERIGYKKSSGDQEFNRSQTSGQEVGGQGNARL